MAIGWGFISRRFLCLQTGHPEAREKENKGRDSHTAVKRADHAEETSALRARSFICALVTL